MDVLLTWSGEATALLLNLEAPQFVARVGGLPFQRALEAIRQACGPFDGDCDPVV
jgi:hypothetical protein